MNQSLFFKLRGGGAGWSTSILFYFTYKFSYFITEYQCPTGYIEKYGDIAGFGIEHEPAASIEACAYRCTHRNDCCAFEFSRISKKCQLHKECFPQDVPFEDYIFCQKSKPNYLTAYINSHCSCQKYIQ